MAQKVTVSDLLIEMQPKHQDLVEVCRKYDDKIASLVQTITDLKKTIPSFIADALKSSTQATGDAAKVMSHDIELSITNIFEKKEKKKNPVLVGLPVGDEESDWERVSQMATKTGIANPEHAIKTVCRDGVKGKKRENSSIIPRIVKIRFQNKAYRETMLKCGRYKKVGNNFVRAYLRNDMTYDERMKDKEMRAELQHRREAEGNQALVIRDGKIVDKRLLAQNNRLEN